MDDSHVYELLHGESLSVSSDRLSELPDSLILEILSLLPMRDVVGTTLLSKRWKDLWTTVPCLDFSCLDFSNIHQDNDLYKFRRFHQDNDLYKFRRFHQDNDLYKFRRFVCGALRLWKGVKIRKFSLRTWRYCNSFISDIYDSWLFFSVEKQVEDLNIDLIKYVSEFAFVSMSNDYCVPQFLHSCSSIKKLSLVSCYLKIDKNVQWNQLKSLTIEERAESLSDVSLNYILSGAPHLEVLDLSFLRENDINIRSSSLKMLKIHTDQDCWELHTGVQNAMLRIWAPNLQSLEISGVTFRMCVLDVPSLTTAILYFRDVYMWLHETLNQVLASILHVQKLTLSYSCVDQINTTVEIFLSHILSGAPNLEVLNLHIWQANDNLNIRSTSLKMLKFYCSPCTRADKTMLRIWAPNLETLEISGFPNRKFLLNAPSLTNAILVLDHVKIALQDMLWGISQSMLNHVEKVTLSDSCTKVLLQMKKYREIPSNAEFLKLIYGREPVKILGVVEMIRQLTMLVIQCNQVMHLPPFGDTRRSSHLLQYLKTVEITWPINDPSIYLAVEILLKNAHMLEKMVFRSLTVSSPESMRLAEEKVRSMPRSSLNAVLIFMNKC